MAPTLKATTTISTDMIRPAHISDIAQALTLVGAFIQEYVGHSLVFTEHDTVLQSRKNQLRLQAMVMEWIRNHYVIMGFDETGQAQGILAAVKDKNYWEPDRIILREIAWYVSPEHRHRRLSAQLFLQWQEDTEKLIKCGTISQASISLPHGHESVDLTRRGWQPLEQHWIKG